MESREADVLMMMDGDAQFLELRQVDKSLWINPRHVSAIRHIVIRDTNIEEVVLFLVGGQTHSLRRSMRDVLACLAGSESYASQVDDDV